ncbi:MAG: sigma-70 family RNA polymerase sigma factor [Xanthomonadales bacterium]|nr:sigma-70 family RNA polymerase sigma factor [Xanthomonadales bacterium]
MKTDKYSSALESLDDASLVVACLEGDHQAFGGIVTRYQRLLCSLAYSSLGNLGESEDVAQEAFVEAWKKLGSLREPEKVKSWLCGILRFKVSHHLRKKARQPIHHAGELHEAGYLESNNEPIEDAAMKEEEKALLWQALETVPETYRETLILYYRENRSVELVASELDLSEDAVKQRLSRGRKLLQEKMMRFVEGALSRSSPGQVFTAGVLAAVGTIAPPAKAAGAGLAAAKLGTAFKWASIVTFLATASGFISSFLALRANLDQSRTNRERRAVVKTAVAFVAVAILFIAGLFGLRYLALVPYGNVGYIAILAQVLVIGFVVGYIVLTVRLLKRARALRTAERVRRPDLFESPDDQPGSRKGEYRSRITLLGVPLIHARFAMAEEGEPPAIGWIAAGHKAYGLLFAWGGFAVAPISVGIVSCGLVTVGAVGFGVVGMGTVGVGLLAMGAAAIGYKAYASLSAMGWESAFSQGFSIAKQAAIGPIAYAEQVNNEMAASISNLSTVNQAFAVILGVMALLVIVPVVWYSRAVRKNFGSRS